MVEKKIDESFGVANLNKNEKSLINYLLKIFMVLGIPINI